MLVLLAGNAVKSFCAKLALFKTNGDVQSPPSCVGKANSTVQFILNWFWKCSWIEESSQFALSMCFWDRQAQCSECQVHFVQALNWCDTAREMRDELYKTVRWNFCSHRFNMQRTVSDCRFIRKASSNSKLSWNFSSCKELIKSSSEHSFTPCKCKKVQFQFNLLPCGCKIYPKETKLCVPLFK